MIKVNVSLKDDFIRVVEVKGHANSAPYGQDLVCAAASSIVYGLGNALDMLSADVDVTIHQNKALFQTSCTKEKTQVILKTGVIQLETLAEVNKDFIKINKMEV